MIMFLWPGHLGEWQILINCSIWLAATDLHIENWYQWADGYQVTWTNWLDGKPNGHTNQDDDCLARNVDGEWDDKDCDDDTNFYYFCEDITGVWQVSYIIKSNPMFYKITDAQIYLCVTQSTYGYILC